MSQADIVELISRRVAEQISAQMAHFEQQLSQLFQQHFARLNARLDLFEARVSERAKLPVKRAVEFRLLGIKLMFSFNLQESYQSTRRSSVVSWVSKTTTTV